MTAFLSAGLRPQNHHYHIPRNVWADPEDRRHPLHLTIAVAAIRMRSALPGRATQLAIYRVKHDMFGRYGVPDLPGVSHFATSNTAHRTHNATTTIRPAAFSISGSGRGWVQHSMWASSSARSQFPCKNVFLNLNSMAVGLARIQSAERFQRATLHWSCVLHRCHVRATLLSFSELTRGPQASHEQKSPDGRSRQRKWHVISRCRAK